MAGKKVLNDKDSQVVKGSLGRRVARGLVLRDYRPADFPRLCQIDRRCFGPPLAYKAPDMAAFLRAPGAVTLVMEDSGRRVVAFLLAHRGHIITVDVLPGWRRRGLATALLSASERRLRAAGIRTLRLETAAANRAGQALYESLGYTRVRRLARYYPDGQDAWVMEKRLVRA